MPFRYIKTTSTAVATKSVLFNGSNQYLKLPSNSSAWTLNGNFTIECWFNTSTTNQNGIFTMNWNGDWNAVYGNGFSLSSNVVVTPQGNTTWTSPSINVWHHIAVVRSGTTLTTYVDGVSVGSQTNSNQFGNASTTPGVGLFDTQGGVRAPFPGYISNLRILKGTALYAGASFTVPTSPLTAIANTSLLTCNADTIVDSSTNNFTITNNNTATVSSVVPFNVVGYGYKFKNVSNPTSGLAGTQKAIFGYGNNGATNYSITNLVSNTGVVATDTTGVGTARHGPAAAGYGTDKAIFGYGTAGAMTNKVSNTGVVATDTTGVGTARSYLAAAGYGSDKAIFGYGGSSNVTNLVSNTGVVANDTAGVGTSRSGLAAAGYGTDKAIFGYGSTNGESGGRISTTNLVSNTGVVATDTTGVGTARAWPAAAGYGSDKAIFGYGYTTTYVSMTNLVSNTGVIATDTTGVGTSRYVLAAACYGSDKSIFGYGQTNIALSMTNLVSNTGVVATDTTGVGTVRNGLAAAGFSAGTSPAPSGLKFKKVFADPVTSIVTSGLVLNLDASNASSYAGSGTSWFDLSGNGNNGTLVNGPTFSSANGGSIVFDGSNDYITLPTNLIIHDSGNPFTFSIWFKTTSTGILLGQQATNTPNVSAGGWVPAIYVGSSGNLITSCFWGNSSTNVSTSPSVVNNNSWNNITVTFQSSIQTSYLNGVSYAALAKTQTNYSPTYYYFLGSGRAVGWTQAPASPYFNGSISNFLYYTKSLSSSEVLQNYNANKGRFGL